MAFKVVVKNNQGILQPQTAFTIKNQISRFPNVEELSDVSKVDVTTGSTIVYNSLNDKYEVRKLQTSYIVGSYDLDGGEF